GRKRGAARAQRARAGGLAHAWRRRPLRAASAAGPGVDRRQLIGATGDEWPAPAPTAKPRTRTRRLSPPRPRRSAAGHGRCGTRCHLVRWHVLNVSGDAPVVAEGILELPRTVSVELVLDRL